MTTPGFHIITSNAMEILAQGLAELLEKPRSNPLIPDTVLVQSTGMQKWASLAVAAHNGICANIDFPFPNAFIEAIYTRVVGPLPDLDPFEPQALGYRIMRILPSFLGRSEFRALDLYLTENQHPLKLFQLSRKIADIFDQYAIFRPRMILDWEKDVLDIPNNRDMADQQWQIILWQALTAQIAYPHRAKRQKQLTMKLTTSSSSVAGLPERLMVFGISHLPPYHLRVLEALSRQIPVYLFLLNPCRHYWSDIISDRQRASIHGKMDDRLASDHWLHLEAGNRLLASLGQQGREFFNLIHQSEGHLIDQFLDNDSHTLLGRIQQDILDLIDHDDRDNGQPAGPGIQDNTIRIHNCHSPMREVEVLFDQLIDIMSQNSSITPRDILVMAPDIDVYLPYIHAVFGVAAADQTRIPYTVADQSIIAEDPDTECFLKLLGVFHERFEASRIMALLEYPIIQQRFGLKEWDLPVIEGWIERAGIRWGWDAQGRKQYGLPGFAENSWRMGLDRLILGYAMSVDDGQLMGELLPFTAIEGDQSRILGGLVHFAESLQQMMQELFSQRTLTSWRNFLFNVIEVFFSENVRSCRNIQLLKDVIGQLSGVEAAAAFTEPIGFDVIYQHLKNVLTRMAYEGGFFSGGVTFCAMLPMRSIPAHVICLLGMNHDAFPRELYEPAFNLIAAAPKPGDRSKRSDDRYLFLESLVSARRFFYLSYIGQDIQDNSIKPPSVILDELVDYIHERFNIPLEQLITRHPLHAFSPQYFSGDDPRLFSYSHENHKAGLSLGNPQPPKPLFQGTLPTLEHQARHCDLADLHAFFIHPTRFLLQKRLGVLFSNAFDPMADRELFTANSYDKYLINNKLIALRKQESAGNNLFPMLNAEGLLPHGSVGRYVYQQQKAEVEAFMRVAEPFLPKDEPRSEISSIRMDPFQLDGLIEDLHGQARIVLRIGKKRPRDLMRLFLTHLMLLLGADKGLPQTSRLICMDEIWEIGPINEATALLRTYLDCYWNGLHTPLPFFEQSSFTYAYLRQNNEASHRKALASAMKKWQGSQYRPGEAQDPYNRRCFHNAAVIPDGFPEMALTVFEPILSHCHRIDEG